MNLGILNTVIAMVIVFLVLSLIVQSVQMFVKKILKLKSRQIVDSLEDLYEQAIETSAIAPAHAPRPTGKSLQQKNSPTELLVSLPRLDASPPSVIRYLTHSPRKICSR